MIRNLESRRNRIARITHWSTAAFVLVMIGIGFYMTNAEFNLNLYQWHKTLGVAFCVFALARGYATIKFPWKSSTVGTKSARKASMGHGLLIVLLFAMPASGLLNSAFSGWSVHFFDWVIVPQNVNDSGEVVPFHQGAYEFFKAAHRYLGYALSILICLHVAVVLKHHFIDKDDTLRRMLGR